jgi:hypothetical protein
MSILEKQSLNIDQFSTNSFDTLKHLIEIIEESEFKVELLELYKIDSKNNYVIKIGNCKQLVAALKEIDSQCKKIDIISKIKDVQLKNLLEEEKALFEIYHIKDKSLIAQNGSDILETETRYSAKNDILDYYNFSKFANYCRDKEYEELITIINDHLKKKNAQNSDLKKLRLIYVEADKKFYIRAITSDNDYKNFGINFSVFVALMSMNEYVEKTQNEIFINRYLVDDSTLYISFSLKKKTQISNNLSLSFNLILENDEIKRGAVSFNGIFKLEYKDKNSHSEIYLKPNGLIRTGYNQPTDLLTYHHRGKVESVLEKIKDLPTLIDNYIEQVRRDAQRISAIRMPDDVRKFISEKIKNAKKAEFQVYKKDVFNKLMSMNVDSTFSLFELLRQVEDLFEHDDVISRDFWRKKLYESLIDKK